MTQVRRKGAGLLHRTICGAIFVQEKSEGAVFAVQQMQVIYVHFVK